MSITAEAAQVSDTTGLTVLPHPTAYRVFVVHDHGRLLGTVVQRGRSYRAIRQAGEPGVDIRRVSDGFRSLAAAVRFIDKDGRDD